MLVRFCLYGLLKNQRYFEPFLVLVFRDKGLSFFVIGLLIGFREVCVNLFEVPSGGAADLYGRRRSMILSFVAYIVSFLIFTVSRQLWTLFAAMLFFALGEAFRSGTHKAMIFDYLARHGRSDEKTQVYGTTRSWSQIGSAASVVIAAAIVLFEGDYSRVFLYSTVPYALNVVNFLGYPAYLDGDRRHGVSVRALGQHLATALRQCFQQARLRGVLLESMIQRGYYATAKDYLQPLLKQTALALPLLVGMGAERRAAVLVGAVYFVLFLLSAAASRQAYRLEAAAGGPDAAARAIWLGAAAIYLVLAAGLVAGANGVAIAAFVALAVVANLWRPIVLERVDRASDAELGATVMSVESQSKSLFVMLAAPLLGLAVDRVGLWPVGGAGALLALAVLATAGRAGIRRSRNSG